MPDDVTNPEGTGGEPANEPVTTPPSPPANVTPPPKAPGQDWEKAYKGLQRNYDKIVKELADANAEVDNLTAAVEAQKQEVRSISTEKDQITTKHVEATEANQALEAQVNVSKTQNERYALIMSEFNDLAQFEAKGLLPQAQTEDEMRSKFESFREALGDTVQKNTDDKLKGIGTGTVDPQTPEPLDADQIYTRMSALAGTKDPEERREYEQLSRKWLEMQENEE